MRLGSNGKDIAHVPTTSRSRSRPSSAPFSFVRRIVEVIQVNKILFWIQNLLKWVSEYSMFSSCEKKRKTYKRGNMQVIWRKMTQIW